MGVISYPQALGALLPEMLPTTHWTGDRLDFGASAVLFLSRLARYILIIVHFLYTCK
jgi:hypothetical protein